jgi:RHS repeat-associated protein
MFLHIGRRSSLVRRTLSMVVTAACWLVMLLYAGRATAAELAVNGVAAPGAVTVATGSTVTVTLTNGPGYLGDWVSLSTVGSANGAYVQWKYLSGSQSTPPSGMTSATVYFVMPATAGTYEFRLFQNNGYTRLATSGTVTTTVGPPPTPPTVKVNGTAAPTTVSAYPLTSVTVDIANGPGSTEDWVALYTKGAPTNNTYWSWQYLNGTHTAPATGMLSASLSFVVPCMATDYELRLYASGVYTTLATSPTVAALAPGCELSVLGRKAPDRLFLPGGQIVTVDWRNGPANRDDWIGLFQVGAGDFTYLDWKYLSGTQNLPTQGMGNASVTFSVPANGEYEFRIFQGTDRKKLGTTASITTGTVPTGETRYHHTDAIGSVRLMTNANGQELSRLDYLPFGQSAPGSVSVDPRQFVGKERETGAGLDYFGARYLFSGIGRFVSVDPVIDAFAVGDPQRWNRYSYARANPLRFADPSGRCIERAQAGTETGEADICQDSRDLSTDSSARDFIRFHEGSERIYKDTAGLTTVGIGHLVKKGENAAELAKMTPEQQEELFAQDVAEAAGHVRKALNGLQVSQNEFNALTDLAFNLGPGVFTRSMSTNLLNAMASGDYAFMSSELIYSKDRAGNRPSGLYTRSVDRTLLFLGADWRGGPR